MLYSTLTHCQPFLHPGQKVFDIPGPGLGVEQGRLHPAVMLQQGRVHCFLPWQWPLLAYEGHASMRFKPQMVDKIILHPSIQTDVCGREIKKIIITE